MIPSPTRRRHNFDFSAHVAGDEPRHRRTLAVHSATTPPLNSLKKIHVINLAWSAAVSRSSAHPREHQRCSWRPLAVAVTHFSTRAPRRGTPHDFSATFWPIAASRRGPSHWGVVDASDGVLLSMQPNSPTLCESCGGDVVCPTCRSTSFVPAIRPYPQPDTRLCPYCSGSGKCPQCFAEVIRAAFAQGRANGN
jgi:hypothetical protein